MMKMITHSVYIENKKIQIEALLVGSNVSVDVEKQIMRWLMDMLQASEREPERLGFIGSQRSSNQNFSVRIKANKGG